MIFTDEQQAQLRKAIPGVAITDDDVRFGISFLKGRTPHGVLVNRTADLAVDTALAAKMVEDAVRVFTGIQQSSAWRSQRMDLHFQVNGFLQR